MRSAILLSISGSAAALPLGDVVNAIFGRDPYIPPPDVIELPPDFPQLVPTGTGLPTGVFPTGTGVPSGVFPTGTGLPTGIAPTGTGGYPYPPGSQIPTLSVDYSLAPTTTVVPEIYGLKEKRQGPESELPPSSFTLVDPSAPIVPSPTDEPEEPFPGETEIGSPPFPEPTGGPEEPPFPIPSGPGGFPAPTGGVPQPTGGFPVPTGGFPGPTGGFPVPTGGPLPTGVFPPFQSTLSTVTRGPVPTSTPEFPELPGYEEDGSSWFEKFKEWLEQFKQWREENRA